VILEAADVSSESLQSGSVFILLLKTLSEMLYGEKSAACYRDACRNFLIALLKADGTFGAVSGEPGLSGLLRRFEDAFGRELKSAKFAR
jgi:hypothetical protein